MTFTALWSLFGWPQSLLILSGWIGFLKHLLYPLLLLAFITFAAFELRKLLRESQSASGRKRTAGYWSTSRWHLSEFRLAQIRHSLRSWARLEKKCPDVMAHRAAIVYQERTEQGRIRITRDAVCVIFGMLFGIVGTLGYVRNQDVKQRAKELRDRWTYTDVMVAERYSSRHFQVQPARMQPVDVILCSPVDWERGQRMIDLYFPPSVDGKCKDVADRGYFHFYVDSEGRRRTYGQEIASNGR